MHIITLLAQTTIDNSPEGILRGELVAYLVQLLTAIFAGLGLS